jgi:hypothetical protein
MQAVHVEAGEHAAAHVQLLLGWMSLLHMHLMLF